MRIDERNPLGPSAPEAGRAGETQKTQREDPAQPDASGAGGDRVELSSTLGRLSQAISDYGAQRASRVNALATDYQHGQYRADPVATSRAIIAQALGEPA